MRVARQNLCRGSADYGAFIDLVSMKSAVYAIMKGMNKHVPNQTTSMKLSLCNFII
jgi:hypothetical protein